MNRILIHDFEVFAHDWMIVFKDKKTKEYIKIHNDNDAVKAVMQENPLMVGFNSKHYDQFIMKAVLMDFTPEQIKYVNDSIIAKGMQGWDIPELKGCPFWFDQYDLMDDCQVGLSLKAIEAHLGMNIVESEIPFDIDRPLTDAEIDETFFYCTHDVDATDILDDLRQGYLNSKIAVGAMAGIPDYRAVYMTNAKLTAEFLGAKPQPHDDERKYVYPANLKKEYIPQEVFDYFNRMYDPEISDDDLFHEKLEIYIKGTPVTIGYGGIHSGVPHYVFGKEVVG